MALPKHVDAEIKARLADIHALLRPGTKVLLVVDAGCADESFTVGDAVAETAIQRIRELEAIASTPSPETNPPHPDPTPTAGA